MGYWQVAIGFNMFQSWVIHGLDDLDGFQISSLNGWPCRTFPISLIDTIFDLAQNVSDWMLGASPCRLRGPASGLDAAVSGCGRIGCKLRMRTGGRPSRLNGNLPQFFLFWGLRLGYHTTDWLVVTGSLNFLSHRECHPNWRRFFRMGRLNHQPEWWLNSWIPLNAY